LNQISPATPFIRIDPLAQTALSGLAERDITRYIEIVKFALQRYLEECLSQEGQFRKFFDHFASFTTGYIINQNFDNDPDKKHFQIARYFDDVKERPPQIFIQDNGHEYHPAGLGGIDEGWNLRSPNGQQVIRVVDVVTIKCQLTGVALSETDINNIDAFLSLAFGSRQFLTCGYILQPKPDPNHPTYWEVRLPLKFNLGGKKHTPLHEDPRQQLWSITCDMDVVYENSVYMTYANQPHYDFQRGSLSVTVPSTIRLGQDVPILLSQAPPRFMCYTSDPKIAVVNKTNLSFTLKPRQPGTCTLFVTSEEGKTQGPSRIMYQQNITVVTR
jgi:hypothetical protein